MAVRAATADAVVAAVTRTVALAEDGGKSRGKRSGLAKKRSNPELPSRNANPTTRRMEIAERFCGRGGGEG